MNFDELLVGFDSGGAGSGHCGARPLSEVSRSLCCFLKLQVCFVVSPVTTVTEWTLE